MLMIRLQRTGRKHENTFRLVLTDSKNSTKSGKYLEVLGSYDPRKTVTSIEADRVKHWMGMGAQVTDTVHNLLINEKVITGKKINVLPKKTVTKKEEVVETPVAAAPKDEVKEEAPAEETPVVEAPVEEAPKVEEVKEEAAPAADVAPEASPEASA